MIVLLSPDSSVAQDLRRILADGDQPVVLGNAWESLPFDVQARALACVCAYPNFMDAAKRTIDRIRIDAPSLPLGLITSGRRQNSRRTGPVKLDDIVWLEDAERDLLPAVAAATAVVSTVERLARIIGEKSACGSGGRVPHTLIQVCRSVPPVPTVGGVAKLAILCEPSLRQKIRAFFGNRPRAASRFLAWLLILSAYDLGRRGLERARIVERLDIDPSTLRREIRQLTGRTMAEFLEQAPRPVLRRALEDLRLLPFPVRPREGREKGIRQP
jgi:hypothetical protein